MIASVTFMESLGQWSLILGLLGIVVCGLHLLWGFVITSRPRWQVYPALALAINLYYVGLFSTGAVVW